VCSNLIAGIFILYLGFVIGLAEGLNQANDMKYTTESVKGRTITVTCYLLIPSKNLFAKPPDR
jgi:hypothetical protein